MKDSVSKFDYCFGCGVCASSCARKAITITLNADGFYTPIVEGSKCVNCGLCLDVCSFNNSTQVLNSIPITCWAAWSDDVVVRQKCSSGGIGFEIGKQLIQDGYRVIACRYNSDKGRAEHYEAKTVDELVQSIGSKYIQSYTPEAIKNIDKTKKYLIVGTPCQIDSLRRFVRKYKCENSFVLMDFFCHCVPSMHAWKAYTRMVEKKIGKITYASWRNKFEYGWHDSWLMALESQSKEDISDEQKLYTKIIQEKRCTVESRKSKGDLFYKLFLGDFCLGPQCQKDCRFKYNHSSADIRIGDLWGKTYMHDDKGVSALVAFTKKGKEVIDNLKGVTLIEHPFEVVAEGQMKKNAQAKELKPIVMYLLENQVPLESSLFKIVFFLQKVITKIKTLV